MVPLSTVTKLVTVIAIAALLAGCVGEPGVEKVNSEHVAAADASSTTAPAANAAPSAVLTATIAGAAAEIVDGTLTIDEGTTVVFTSAGSSDPEDDALTFAWTMDDAAAGADATLTHAFPAAGTHTVALTVSDGLLQVTEDLDVVVDEVVVVAPPSAKGAIAAVLEGTFAADATAVATHPITVPDGTTSLQAWLVWDDGETGNMPILVDLDLFLKGPSGAQVAAAETSDFEYIGINDTAKLTPGAWTAEILPYDVPFDTAYTFNVIAFTGTGTTTVFTGSEAGSVNTGLVGEPGTGTVTHALTIPEGTVGVTARLTWLINSANANIGSCARASRTVNDFDLYVTAGGAEQFRSGNGVGCEFGYKVAAAGSTLPSGEWTFEVRPWIVPNGEYTLTVEYI